jgi:hypothetical protein
VVIALEICGVVHGFVRSANVEITSFDAPGAGIGLQQGTIVLAINTAGAVTGIYKDADNMIHSYVMVSDGTITPFDVPGDLWTYAASINGKGTIAGYYAVKTVFRGFQRSPGGSITTVQVPQAKYTYPQSINQSSVIAGFYVDAESVTHGFVRTP